MSPASEEFRLELYGPDRNIRYNKIKDTLTKSHVLQNGEYNFTSNRLKYDTWKTNHSMDFLGTSLEPNHRPINSSQLVHHFDIGNMSGKLLDKDIFRRSTTKLDFKKKEFTKPEMCVDTRTINWPDMAPRYSTNRRVGPSEYASTFIKNLRNHSAPNFPRVDTSKLQLPLDPEKFWRQRNTNFSLGTNDDGLISEQQRAYGKETSAFKVDEKEKNAAKIASMSLKELDKVSHVFREGDYNDIVGNFVSTCVGDYGPRTVPTAEAAFHKKQSKQQSDNNDKENEKEKNEEDETPYANVNQLQKFARETTVPQVFKDASDGRFYQSKAHFHFGHDPETLHSIYSKDFALSAMADRKPPVVKATPSAGKILQFEPNQSKNGITSSSLDFQNFRYEPYRNSHGKTSLEMNLDRRDTDNVIFSFDRDRHQLDRQKSVNHSDYIGPPKGYRPPKHGDRHDVKVDFLQTDDALPYPTSLDVKSEAAQNFTGLLTSGNSAITRRSNQNRSNKGRLEDGRSTHFVVGYTPFDFSSETQMRYRGDAKNDQAINAAGKTDTAPPQKALHLSHSENVLDLRAADPHFISTRESLPARMAYTEPVMEKFNTTSIMKKDYGPLGTRSMLLQQPSLVRTREHTFAFMESTVCVTDAQLKVIQKYEKMNAKDISKSHLFHSDTSGRNNFKTTAMEDFIQPVHMTAKAFACKTWMTSFVNLIFFYLFLITAGCGSPSLMSFSHMYYALAKPEFNVCQHIYRCHTDADFIY